MRKVCTTPLPWFALFVLPVLSCADYYELGIQGPLPPMAVGSAATYQMQYAVWWKCRNDKVITCGVGNPNRIMSVSEIKVDDPSLLQAMLAANFDIPVRALAAGTTQLTATGIDVHGETKSVSRPFYLLTPQQAVLSPSGACAAQSPGSVLTVPVNSDLSFFPEVKNGTTTLYSEGLTIPIDSGSLLHEPGAPPFQFKTPSVPTTTQVKSLFEQPFTVPVRVYEPGQIDAIKLRPVKAGPYYLGTIYTAWVDLQVMGDRVCQEVDPAPVRSVTVLTPDLCQLRLTSDVNSDVVGTTQESASLPFLYIQGKAVGNCRIQLAIKDTAITSIFELPLESVH